MAAPVETGLVYDDLARFPDDGLRRELIGGDLFVAPAPRTRHQAAVRELIIALGLYAKRHGGTVFSAPLDVWFTDVDVVEPDVLYIAQGHGERIEERFIRGAPDIVVEVSSPSTRHLDLGRKRQLYERHGVAEYWYVDLDAAQLEVYRLDATGRYHGPMVLTHGDRLSSPQLPGFELEIDVIMRGTDPNHRDNV